VTSSSEYPRAARLADAWMPPSRPGPPTLCERAHDLAAFHAGEHEMNSSHDDGKICSLPGLVTQNCANTAWPAPRKCGGGRTLAPTNGKVSRAPDGTTSLIASRIARAELFQRSQEAVVNGPRSKRCARQRSLLAATLIASSAEGFDNEKSDDRADGTRNPVVSIRMGSRLDEPGRIKRFFHRRPAFLRCEGGCDDRFTNSAALLHSPR